MKDKSRTLNGLKQFLGIQNETIMSEKVASTVGAIIVIIATFYVSAAITGYTGAMAILPSMGAATVLLFAVPHGQLSTPWSLFAGNLISAAIGVTCGLLVDEIVVAAGLAVGLSILAMHFCRCIHPPGGATALAAIIGGEAVRELGYWYVVAPTLINCSILFLIAVLFNNQFHWRRYPQSLMRYRKIEAQAKGDRLEARHIAKAIEQSNVVLDVSADQIQRIVNLAHDIMRKEAASGFTLHMGAFYTNGRPGIHGSVRQVIDEREHPDPAKYMVIYRTVEGAGKGMADSCSLSEFIAWADDMLKST